jgi:hypothetical protein
MYPSLRFLRDSLLVRDPAARQAGEALLNRVMLLSTMNTRLPPDRLVCTEDAARIIGVDPTDFDRLAYQAQIKPRYVLVKTTYWMAKDVYSLID